MIRTARFDATEAYRYELRREWGVDAPLATSKSLVASSDKANRAIAFLMLNPSTADAYKEDPTVRRCINYAFAWGYGALEVINIFALRSTDPEGLKQVADPVGPDNDRTILEVAGRVDLVVAAWGTHGELLDRGRQVVRLMERHGHQLYCLGTTKSGQPVHPLYQPGSAQPIGFPVRPPV